ncbi:MAG TPA: matrixin family metalloprotease, partial [Methanotrichaceae archaeon]|nr:matrixin family metalloprotease [Methanotrichaceae archaeon]
LGDEASLQETTVISSEGLAQSREAGGSGNSRLNQQISGQDYSINDNISSSGSLMSKTSSSATGQGAEVSQTLEGSGSISLDLHGIQGSGETVQEASVADGALSSSQSLIADQGTASSQSTSAIGQSSIIATSALSANNYIQVAGAAGNDGRIDAGLISEASTAASLGGTVSMNGMNYLSNGDLNDISSNNIGVAVNSLYSDSNGDLQKFDLNAISTDASTYKKDVLETTSNLDTPTSTQSYGARAGAFNSYSLGGWKWMQADPQVQLYLKADSNLQSMGLDASKVRDALAADASIWDATTSQKLFAQNNPVIIDSSKQTDTRDGYNVIAWKNSGFSSSSTLALTRTWYQSTLKDGSYPVIESDMSFNMADRWSTNGDGNFDVQAAALHEMGHIIGLDDIYNKPDLSQDTCQIMNYYTGVRHSLGNGDMEGVRAMYGQ